MDDTDMPGTASGPGPRPEQPGFYHGQPLASWKQRALALLLDCGFGLLLLAPGGILFGMGAAIDNGKGRGSALLAAGGVLLVMGIVVQIWQMGWRQGSRGRSWGKQAFGLQTVRASDLQLLGGWVGVGRFLIEDILTGNLLTLLLTYLWPLRDRQHQTWHDKIANSVVLNRAAPQ